MINYARQRQETSLERTIRNDYTNLNATSDDSQLARTLRLTKRFVEASYSVTPEF